MKISGRKKVNTGHSIQGGEKMRQRTLTSAMVRPSGGYKIQLRFNEGLRNNFVSLKVKLENKL